MGGFDGATWQALGLTVTLLGLVVTVLVWRRRGPVSGLRALAWSLLPLAAGLTGVLRLGWDIADSIVSWAVRLAFSPVVWLGVVLAGIAGVLFVVSGFLERRRPAKGALPPATKSTKRRAAANGPRAVAATGSTAASAGRGGPATVDNELADIEELLRKHGIS